jgi:hypothetical protein
VKIGGVFAFLLLFLSFSGAVLFCEIVVMCLKRCKKDDNGEEEILPTDLHIHLGKHLTHEARQAIAVRHAEILEIIENDGKQMGLLY